LARAEVLKLTSTRVLLRLLPLAAVLGVAAVTAASLSADGAGISLDSNAGIRRALHVSGSGAVIVLVLGIVMSAGEYRISTATDTFLTTPQRSRVLLAKLLTASGIGAGFGVFTATVCGVAAFLAFKAEGFDLPLDSSEVWLTLLGAVAYIEMFALIGVAVGNLLRNQVTAIIAALAWLLVAEQILVASAPDVAKWLPGTAGQAIVRTPDREQLGPLAAVLLLGGYCAAISIASVIVTNRRDA
jgi:hypothetical protein